MPYYPHLNFLLIHIPKTGGSSVEVYLSTKSHQTLYSSGVETNPRNIVLPGDLRSISLQHQTYRTINKFRSSLGIPRNCRTVSIVRDPYDRAISDLFWATSVGINEGSIEISRTSSPAEIYAAMVAHHAAGHLISDNHTLPQYEFVIGDDGKLAGNITIFRTEELTSRFRKYGFKDYNGPSVSKSYRKYLNADSITFINRYYGKDFDMFGYKRLDPATPANWDVEKVALMCRIKNERYIREFVDYYLAEGVTHIYLFDDMSTLYLEELDTIRASDMPVTVIRAPLVPYVNTPAVVLRGYEQHIRHYYDWVINVDADEYIVPCKNKGSTICKELKRTFRNVNCVYVPWVMMGFQGREKDPGSLLLETLYRWDHDKRHPNEDVSNTKFRCRYDSIEYKSIWRPSQFEQWGIHTPNSPISPPVCVDAVRCAPVKGPREVTSYHLSESDIATGHLLCYHYRLASKEHARRKTQHQTQNLYRRSDVYEGLLSNDFNEVYDDTVKKRVLARPKTVVQVDKAKLEENRRITQASQRETALRQRVSGHQAEQQSGDGRLSSMTVVGAVRNKGRRKKQENTVLQKASRPVPPSRQAQTNENRTTGRKTINYPIL